MALARFALPTLAAWLVSPLMSLVDTAVVGRDSVTALSLAALGPATMVGDSMAYLFSFLGVATTNLVATARSEERRDRSGAAPGSAPGAREVADLFGNAVRLAVLCGLGSAILQLALGRAVLARYTAARSAALVAPAYQYVRVRALGAPAALLVRVGTATCLALKDPLAPLLAVALGGALNVALDLLLVTWLGRGIGGAAWATVVSEAVCAAVVLRAARIKLAAEPATAVSTICAAAAVAAAAAPLAAALTRHRVRVRCLCQAAGADHRRQDRNLLVARARCDDSLRGRHGGAPRADVCLLVHVAVC